MKIKRLSGVVGAFLGDQYGNSIQYKVVSDPDDFYIVHDHNATEGFRVLRKNEWEIVDERHCEKCGNFVQKAS